MPVEDAADERRDQEHAGLRAGRRLREREQQRQVAVDALPLEDLRRADALPRRGDLDEDALAPDAALLVGADDPPRLVDRGRGVEGKIRIDLRRDPPGHDAGKLRAEGDGEPVAHGGRDRLGRAGLAAAPGERLLDERSIGGRLHGLQEKRRIGRAVLRFQAPHRLDVARIGDDDGHGAELLELGGHGWFRVKGLAQT